MSMKHPIIAVTGSSGAGTTTVSHTFEAIFERENVNAAVVEGDSFHRYTRDEMKRFIEEAEAKGEQGISHFGPEANLFEDLENLFRAYSESATGSRRHYIHNAEQSARWDRPPGTFTDWEPLPDGTDCLFYEGLHGGSSARTSTSPAMSICSSVWCQRSTSSGSRRFIATPGCAATASRRYSMRSCDACTTTCITSSPVLTHEHQLPAHPGGRYVQPVCRARHSLAG